ncbi:MAG: hypothetical protein QNJ92_16895 [Alphaproteobacteria bacterium]|nr:hypothetical protein [Alphaproteobacteria bacterium]
MKTPSTDSRLTGPWSRAVALATLAVSLLTGSAHAADPTFPPGSKIGMVPPAGFVVSPDFAGFMDQDAGASIVITEMPGDAFNEISSGLGKEQFAAQGMTLLGACTEANPSVEHVCLRLSQEGHGIRFLKWTLIAKLGDVTGLIAVNIPEQVVAGGHHSAAAIEAALSTVTYTAQVATKPIDTLPFTIEEGELLPFHSTLQGRAAAYGRPTDQGGPHASLVVAAAFNASPVARSIDHSRAAFKQIAAVMNAQITDEGTASVGPLSGHLLEGTGRDDESGTELYLFQAILVDADDMSYALIGIAPVTEKEVYRAEFLRLMQTLKLR